MKHLVDITKMHGANIPPCSVITFGSPCQNLSQAGNRKGLAGKESSLFFEATRVIKEMLIATNYEYPKYIVWENVAGAFSSNKGEDFHAVLEELVGLKETISIPRPERGIWSKSGFITGNDWSIAWRLMDAQFGECPSAAVESRLSWILQSNVPEKYYLSQRALEGILRRSAKRGKPLPEFMQQAIKSKLLELTGTTAA